ncbi:MULTISPECIES: nuclear transport factor 2 family protein [Streptosporangium]|uniref:Ketosteroid isomerase-like protein n=1 Tax=Streptosporangium brasiliense TaxID=47480 RepID=A0ABT9R6G6_9ACTN|nr:nuclear transport factor 2 family protein [Streptosporangium brasiliense]MDP9864457.1 ketosteroid isomerase-like protein [Streptosporangium brasiliense]
MTEHPNIALARDSYDALSKGDLDHIRDNLLADDVVFHVPGRGPLAGDYRGKDQVLGYLARLTETTDGSVRFEPESILPGDDRAMATVRVRGERAGRQLDDRGVHVFRIADGRISERWSYPENLYSTDDFFA